VNHVAKLLIEAGLVLSAGNETIISAVTDGKMLVCPAMSQAYAAVSDLLYASDVSPVVKRLEAVKAGTRECVRLVNPW